MTTHPAPAATAARAVAAALTRQLLTTIGAALAAHGIIDQGAADSLIGPVADVAIGAGIVIGSAAWSAMRAQLSHARWRDAWNRLFGDDA